MIVIAALNCAAIPPALYTPLLLSVSPSRQHQASHFTNRLDALHCICGELLIYYLLKTKEKEITHPLHIATTAYGKPYLPDFPTFHFNISHSGRWLVCAVGSSELGVDIEKRNRGGVDIARRFFSPEECDEILSCDEDEQNERFVAYWTAKESYIKCLGGGMSVPLDSFTIRGDRIVKDGVVQPYRLHRIEFDSEYELVLCAGEGKEEGGIVLREVGVGEVMGEDYRTCYV